MITDARIASTAYVVPPCIETVEVVMEREGNKNRDGARPVG